MVRTIRFGVLFLLAASGCTATGGEPAESTEATLAVTSATSPPTTTTTTEAPGQAGPLPRVEAVFDYGGDGFDYATAVAVAPDGGFVTSLDHRSAGSASGDIVVLSHAPDGSLQWSRGWGGEFEDTPLRNTIAIDGTGAVHVAGAVYDAATQQRDIVVFKSDPQGELVWQRVASGIEGDQRPHVVAVGDDGSVYIGGHHDLHGLEGHGHIAMLLRFSPSGETMWQLGLVGDGSAETAYSGTLDSEDNFVVAGTVGVAGEVDAFIARVAPDGSVLWQGSWGVPGSPERAWDVVTDPEDNIYVSGPVVGSGNGGDSTFVIKVDPEGNLIWARTWTVPGNEVWGHGAAFDGDLLVLSGFIRTVAGDGVRLDDSAYLLGISSDGELLWQAAVGSSGGVESIEGVGFLPDGDLVAVGQGARRDLSVVPLSGRWDVSDVPLTEAALEVTALELTFADGYLEPQAGPTEPGSGPDAVIIRLSLP